MASSSLPEVPPGSLVSSAGCGGTVPAATPLPAAACAATARLTVLYPCKRAVYPKPWWERTMLEGARFVCYDEATAEDVAAAHVLVAALRVPRQRKHGWDHAASLLPRLRLPAEALAGKVLIHLDDEYGAKSTLTEGDFKTYCHLYAGWRRVFRNYWSEGWASRVGRNHAMNCSGMLGCASSRVGYAASAGGGSGGSGARRLAAAASASTLPRADPRVEWTPLGWSANWRHTADFGAGRYAASSARSTQIGFYGNEKWQLKPNRRALINKFEAATGAKVTHLLGKAGFGRGNASHYAMLMGDTKLCLQISGLSAECYRMYEALDAGCVPILIDTFGKEVDAQYRFLLPPRRKAPFPRAETANGLKETLSALASDGAKLDAMQAEVRRWWNASLSHVRSRVRWSAWSVCRRAQDAE